MVDVKTENEPVVSEGKCKPAQSREPDSFSLAHLSDLHLTSLNAVRIPQLLNKRMLGYCSWWHKRRHIHRREIIDSLIDDLRDTCPDHIAVTGDLTHLGLPTECAEVGQWLPSLGAPEQVTVIPGNHEAYWGKDWLDYCAMWAPYMKSDTTQWEASKTVDLFPSVRIRGQVALIGLSSATPSLPLLAIGSLGQEQLLKLENVLQDTGNKGLFRIILIHHPPVSGLVNWRKRLTDSREFADVLARHGAELVLNGHAHNPTLSKLQTPGGDVPVVGGASASQLSPPSSHNATYNIYRLSRVGAGWDLTMLVRRYSEKSGGFVEDQQKTLNIPQF
jgi:3',5'-cyclic AMP phosphodiesterase CpdA